MRIHTLTAVAFTACCATLASAQASPASPKTDDGFFRPAPDPSLTAPRPQAPARPTEALVAEDKVQASAETNTDRAPDPVKVMQWSERQMDRAEQEAERAKPAPNAPAPINGAFTGLTGERNR